MTDLIWIGNTLYPQWVISAALGCGCAVSMFGVSYALQMLIRRLYPRDGENL